MPDWAGYLKSRPAFGAVIDPRRYSLEWLDAQILRGQAQCWCSDDAAIVTELRHYPTGATDIHALIATGALRDIVDDLRPRAEGWARSIGCLGAIVVSRAGWATILKTHGYAPYQLALRKDFADGPVELQDHHRPE